MQVPAEKTRVASTTNLSVAFHICLHGGAYGLWSMTFGRMDSDVITKISRIDWLPYFLAHDAPRARLRFFRNEELEYGNFIYAFFNKNAYNRAFARNRNYLLKRIVDSTFNGIFSLS